MDYRGKSKEVRRKTRKGILNCLLRNARKPLTCLEEAERTKN